MRTTIGSLLVIACLASSQAGGIAFADKTPAKPASPGKPTSPKALEHLSRGSRLYANRSFEEAIAEFKAGALDEPAAVFDYDLGQAYRQLGRYEDALWHYDRFLKYGEPTGELLEIVQRFMREMREHLANRPRTMPPTDAASEVDQPSKAAAVPPAQIAATVTTAQPERETAAQDGSTSWVGVGVTATGALALGASGLLFLNASSLDDEANAEANTRTRNDLHDRSRTRRIVGAVVGVGGVVLTATGVYMLVAHGGRRTPRTAAAFDFGIRGDGLVVFGRF